MVVEIHAGWLTRVDPAGRKTLVADVGGGPNGAAIGPDGRVYICNNGGQVPLQIGDYRFSGGPPPGYTSGSVQAVELATGYG